MRMFKNRRGLSPIFATLILIAIAVIAGIVVYMFTSGTIASMTGGGTAGQEKLAIQGVEVGLGTNSTALAQNTGTGTIVISSVIVKDAQGNVISSEVPLASGETDVVAPGIVFVDFTTPGAGTYTVTLVSTKGGSFVSPSFIVGP